MTTAQLAALIGVGLALFLFLLWHAYDTGRHAGRIDAYKQIGQQFRAGRRGPQR